MSHELISVFLDILKITMQYVIFLPPFKVCKENTVTEVTTTGNIQIRSINEHRHLILKRMMCTFNNCDCFKCNA